MNGPLQKIGVLGGSFNPVHNGHLHLACGFYERLGLDRVLLVPVFLPPHKSSLGMADGSLRLEMCRLACEEVPWLEPCDIELKRAGRSYTADTLTELHRLYPGAELHLLMGTDMFFTLEHWRDFGRIARMSVLCCACRTADCGDAPERYARELTARFGARCVVERLPVVELSSTEVRERVARGESVEGLVPGPVGAFIERQGLYKTPQW